MHLLHFVGRGRGASLKTVDRSNCQTLLELIRKCLETADRSNCQTLFELIRTSLETADRSTITIKSQSASISMSANVSRATMDPDSPPASVVSAVSMVSMVKYGTHGKHGTHVE